MVDDFNSVQKEIMHLILNGKTHYFCSQKMVLKVLFDIDRNRECFLLQNIFYFFFMILLYVHLSIVFDVGVWV